MCSSIFISETSPVLDWTGGMPSPLSLRLANESVSEVRNLGLCLY